MGRHETGSWLASAPLCVNRPRREDAVTHDFTPPAQIALTLHYVITGLLALSVVDGKSWQR